MDPLTITLITNALAMGASSTVETSKDTYQTLKNLVRRRFGDEPEALLVLNKYEEKPEVWRGPLRDKLEQVHADQDEEIVKTAQNLIALTKPQQANAYVNVNSTRTSLENIYRKYSRQARLWSLFSLIAVVIGFLLVLGGTDAISRGLITPGMITIITGTAIEFAVSLLFRGVRQAYKQLDRIRQKLIETDTIIDAMTLALSTNNEDLKQKIILRSLQLLKRDQEQLSLSSD